MFKIIGNKFWKTSEIHITAVYGKFMAYYYSSEEQSRFFLTANPNKPFSKKLGSAIKMKSRAEIENLLRKLPNKWGVKEIIE